MAQANAAHRYNFLETLDFESLLDLDGLLKKILQVAVDSLEAQEGTLLMLGGHARLGVKAWRSHNLAPLQPDEAAQILEHGFAGWVASNKSSAIIQDIQHDERWHVLRDQKRPKSGAAIGTPLTAHGRVLGVMTLTDPRPGYFRAADIGFLENLASQAGVILGNASLLSVMRALRDAGPDIAREENPEAILEMVVERARKAFDAWRAEVFINDHGAWSEVVALGENVISKQPKVIRATGKSMLVYSTGIPWICPDIQQPDFKQEVNPGLLDDAVRAVACMPLIFSGRCFGVMWLQFRIPRDFSWVERSALEIYANQAAVAFQHADRTLKMEQLRAAAYAFAKPATEQEVVQQLLAKTRILIGGDIIIYQPYDALSKTFVKNERAIEGAGTRDTLVLLEAGLAELAHCVGTHLMQVNYFHISHVDAAEPVWLDQEIRLRLSGINIQSLQGILIKVADESVGMLLICYKQQRTFQNQDQELLDALVTHAALALKKARLMNQVKRISDAASTIAKVSILDNVGQTLNTIVQNVYEVLRCDIVTIYAYHEEQQVFKEWATVGADSSHSRQSNILTEQSVVWKILKLERPYWVNQNIGEHAWLYGEFARQERVEATLCICLRVNQSRVGVMFVNYRQPHQFTEEEIAVVELFANQAAVAIRNQQLYLELRQTKGLVGARTALAWMGMASNFWFHSVYTRAATIRGRLELLLADDPDMPAKAREQLAEAQKSLQAILDARITPDLSQEQRTWVVLDAFLKEWEQKIQGHLQKNGVVLQLELGLTRQERVMFSPDWLGQALDLLLDNSITALKERAERRIVIRTWSDADWAMLEFADNGPGIPPEIKEGLFNQRIPDLYRRGGLGIGLMMAQVIVEAYGGAMKLAHSSDTGTTMNIRLPLFTKSHRSQTHETIDSIG